MRECHLTLWLELSLRSSKQVLELGKSIIYIVFKYFIISKHLVNNSIKRFCIMKTTKTHTITTTMEQVLHKMMCGSGDSIEWMV